MDKIGLTKITEAHTTFEVIEKSDATSSSVNGSINGSQGPFKVKGRPEIPPRSLEDVTKEAQKEAKHSQNPQPWLGPKSQYGELFLEHREWNKEMSISESGFVPQPFNKVLQKVISAGELRTLQLPTRKQMVVPWLKEGDAAMLYAPAGLGKSFLTLTIAMAVAGGGKVKGLNYDAPETSKVLYVDGEMPTADIVERMNMIIGNGWIEGFNEAEFDENFKLLARLGQDHDEWVIDLAQEATHKLIGGHALESGVKLVVLDNLSTLSDTMEDENSASSFRLINTFISKLKRRGIAVLVVHHANKAGDGYRGSSNIGVIYDAIIQLAKVTQANGTKGRGKTSEEVNIEDELNPRVRIIFEKFRGKRSEETVSRVMRMMEFGYVTVDGAEEDQNLQTVVNLIANTEHAGLSNRQAQALCGGLHISTIWKKVQKTVELGLTGPATVRETFSVLPVDVETALIEAETAEF